MNRPSGASPKSLVTTRFAADKDPHIAAQEFTSQGLYELFQAIRGELPWAESNSLEAARRFLFASCARFDRWSTPTPIVVARDQHQHFKELLDCLLELEGPDSPNTPYFEGHRLLSEVYGEFDCIDIQRIDRARLQTYREVLEPVRTRASNDPNAKQACDCVNDILDGLEDGSLRSTIGTMLPYALHTSPLDIRFRYRDMAVRAKVTVEMKQAEGLATILPMCQPKGPSRWQAAVTKIELQYNALVDFSAWAPPMIVFEELPLPVDGWPQWAIMAFENVHDLAWNLRLNYGGELQWVPAPRDLGATQLDVSAARRPRMESKSVDSPGCLMMAFGGVAQPIAIDLGDIREIPWHRRCRELAKIYLEIGETNEALFWLNVGVEALLLSRFSDLRNRCPKDNLDDLLASKAVYWDDAERVIAEQHPDLAGRTKWPDSGAHVSLFRKLKYVLRHYPFTCTERDAIAHYSVIWDHRNDLFHGSVEQRCPVEAVTSALQSFDWIDMNFTVKPVG